MEVKEVTVVGAGIMGHGIAEVLALSGYKVNLADTFKEALEKGKQSIEKSLERLVKSGKIDEEKKKNVMGSIIFGSEIGKIVHTSDMVIEAVPEVLDIKANVFSELDRHCKPGAILASNTSNIKITDLAKATKRPDKVVGIHFFNPPVLMKLVEVIKNPETSEDTFQTALDLVRKTGKTPIRVMKDSAGFVVNRINAPESLFFCLVLDQKVARPEEVDAFAKSQGLPMGPYELMDYVGLDTVVHSLNYYAKELSADYGKCRIFPDMLEKGLLGAKSGKGFYDWSSGKAAIPKAEPTDKLELMDVLAVEVNEAVKVLEEGISTPEEVETGVRLGMNRPFGPITVAKGLTNSEIKRKLEDLQKRFSVDLFAPARSIREGKLKEIITKGNVQQEDRTPGKQAAPAKPEAESGALITVEKVDEKVARILLSNTRNNLISSQVISELERAIKELWNDREVSVIIVTGKGERFSAGAQLSEFIAGGMDFTESARRGERVYRMLSEIPKITIAEMKGYALGGGFELALGCDLRISTEETQMGFPELKRGLLPGWGGSQRLSKLIGMSRALHYILTTEYMNGKEAKEIGLVSRLYPAESIDSDTEEFAKDLSRKVAPPAAALAKRLINKGSEMSMDNGLEMESIAMGLLYGTDDLREGISAFLEKREPNFKGR